ncbi:MAG: glycosyltransferase family 4 protein [Myxococcota bacterium]
MPRILTIGHSYCVALNRRLADEMHRRCPPGWTVEAAAPAFFHGDLRPVPFEPSPPGGAETTQLRVFGSRSPHAFVYHPKALGLLRRGWDLVHVWEEPYVLSGAELVLGAPAETKLVLSTAQNLDKRYPPPFSWLERAVLRRCDGFVAFGRTVADCLARRPAFRGQSVSTIAMGVDLALFRPDPEAGAAVRASLGWAPEGAPVIGYLGRMAESKGLPMLLRAMDALDAPWRALFVGDGPMRAEVEAWGQRHGDRVRVAPPVHHEDVPRYLSAMDLLCAPSQTTPTWMEQFGRMLSEAMACGVPVIGSDSGEIPHTIGDAGLVVGEKDQAGWTAAMDELLRASARRDALREAGLARARERFGWEAVADAHLEAFERVLG